MKTVAAYRWTHSPCQQNPYLTVGTHLTLSLYSSKELDKSNNGYSQIMQTAQ